VSNYRSGYGFHAEAFPGGRALTGPQRRRLRKKSNRCTYVYGGQYPPNPSAARAGASGHPGGRSAVHYQVSGWVGPAGACGVECVCGVTFGGFDTIGEASALLARHVAADRRPRTRPPLRGSFSRYVAIRVPAPVPVPEPMFPSVEYMHRMEAPPPPRRPGTPAWAKRLSLVERAR
jgi:hypothetical protein